MSPFDNTAESKVTQVTPEAHEPRWLSYAALAEKIGVCPRTIRRDVDAGKLPKPIKIRACVRFDWLDVSAALNTRK